jgi:transaldolase
MHWNEFIGGDVVISLPYSWQVRFNASDIELRPRMDKPVNPEIVNELSGIFPDFRRPYCEGGLSPEEFDSFRAMWRTLRQFSAPVITSTV